MRDSPCKNFPDRSVDCHAGCDLYKEFSKQNTAEREALRLQKSRERGLRQYYIDLHNRISKGVGR